MKGPIPISGPIQISACARDAANRCLKMAAKAEKAQDRKLADALRARAAECFRFAQRADAVDQSIGNNVIKLFG